MEKLNDLDPIQRLASAETSIEHIDKNLDKIWGQVSNHIPTAIAGIGKELNSFKLTQAKLFVGILITTIATLIGVVCSIIMR